jgi:hypothetical protein
MTAQTGGPTAEEHRWHPILRLRLPPLDQPDEFKPATERECKKLIHETRAWVKVTAVELKTTHVDEALARGDRESDGFTKVQGRVLADKWTISSTSLRSLRPWSTDRDHVGRDDTYTRVGARTSRKY